MDDQCIDAGIHLALYELHQFLPGITVIDTDAIGYPLIGRSASTNVAGTLSMVGFRLAAGLVGVTQQGPKGVGTAVFDVRGVLNLPGGAADQPGFVPVTEPKIQ